MNMTNYKNTKAKHVEIKKLEKYITKCLKFIKLSAIFKVLANY